MIKDSKKIKKFSLDLKYFYNLIQKKSREINDIYNIFDSHLNRLNKSFKHSENETLAMLTKLCQQVGLENNKSSLMAMCDRLINLKEGPIIQELKRHKKSEDEILFAKRFLLGFVSDFYAKRHQNLLEIMEKEKLFSEFYREILIGTHKIGLAMNKFFSSWQSQLIDDFNKNMQKKYGDDEALKLLAPSVDKEMCEGKLIHSDRSYSVAQKSGDEYIGIPYALAYETEILNIDKAIKELLGKLEILDDENYDKKQAYVLYFKALKRAFEERNKDNLIKRWREVDVCWMSIDTPFQIGHPLEYYEDRYRHAVAPEWDMRFSNPDKISDSRVPNSIKTMFEKKSIELSAKTSLIDFVCKALEGVKLYSGIPALYYGANMNGLFSAQVVPNDEVVSKQYGKKIFAFGDKIIESAKSKPKMKLAYEVFENSYLQQARDILFDDAKMWHLVYDITTNGHEFGHILWIQEDTQRLMNVDGEFKNIEEFKATCGGLVAFFLSDYSQEEFDAVMSDTIRRSVGLMAWREQEEVLPYYCEGLIHLFGAFVSGVLEFDPTTKSVLRVNKNEYESLKQWYLQTYNSLASHYIMKLPAGEWLKKFIQKTNKDYHLNLLNANVFVEWYWKRYKEIGHEIL